MSDRFRDRSNRARSSCDETPNGTKLAASIESPCCRGSMLTAGLDRFAWEAGELRTRATVITYLIGKPR